MSSKQSKNIWKYIALSARSLRQSLGKNLEFLSSPRWVFLKSLNFFSQSCENFANKGKKKLTMMNKGYILTPLSPLFLPPIYPPRSSGIGKILLNLSMKC
jgi:hypothetical protein